jgi:hypothetical protein
LTCRLHLIMSIFEDDIVEVQRLHGHQTRALRLKI